MAKAGRKRKANANREASGKVQRTYVNPKAQVAAQPHRLEAPNVYRMFPEAGTGFGCLMLNKHLTPAQHEAGKRYAEDTAAYRAQILGAPSADPQTCDLLRIGGKGGDGEETPRAMEIARVIKRTYNAAFEAVSEAGNRPARAVKDHAVFGKPVHCEDGYTLKLLRLGLDKLVSHYGIDSKLQITHRPK